MAVAVVGHVFVHLIGDGVQVVTDHQLQQLFQLPAAPHLSAGIVGRGEDERFGFRGDEGFEPVEIDLPARRMQGKCPLFNTPQIEQPAVITVKGLELYHLVAAIEQGEHGGHKPAGRSGRNHNVARALKGNAVETEDLFHNAFFQLGHAVVGCVNGFILIDGPFGAFFYGIGRGHVADPLAEVDAVHSVHAGGNGPDFTLNEAAGQGGEWFHKDESGFRLSLRNCRVMSFHAGLNL